ncbi:MAG TPA: DNA polymerase III subunit gamma/tau [Chloroflexi bacterium]|nr:DNA polymerase III subunit gamma/tau [Chloroflexota bacterium]
MAQQALYRKWRSQTFDELVGQEHVVRTLRNALQSGRVRHAYLFTGPRGTGKTSSARILAKAVNCLAPEAERPCDRCPLCRAIATGSSLDLIEIDAASNTGVDKVREAIIEKVNFAPSEGRYKVYIIDEVHMLSTSAFNALLKTLEEPPPYAIFILATTEVHKVPATILSRCQRLDFRRIPVERIVDHLRYILEQEKIEAEPAVLELVARQATGSMRDAQSLLDQLLAYGGDHLTLDHAREALGFATNEAVIALVHHLLAQDVAGGLALVNALLDQGVDPRQFLVEVLEYLRQLLLVVAGGGRTQMGLPEELVAHLRVQAQSMKPAVLVEIIKLFNQAGTDMRVGLQPQLPLELAVVEAVLKLQAHGLSPFSPAQRVVADRRPVRAPARLSARETPPESARGAPVLQEPTTNEGTERRPPEFEGGSPPEPPPQWDDLVPGPPGRDVREDQPPSVVVPTPSVQAETRELPPLDWWLANWEAFLARLRERDAVGRRLAARLKFCEPRQVESGTLVLGFFYSIHRDKIEELEARRASEEALATFCGQPRVALKCELAPKRTSDAPAKTKFEEAAEDPVVRAAMRLGGRIVDVRLPNQT